MERGEGLINLTCLMEAGVATPAPGGGRRAAGSPASFTGAEPAGGGAARRAVGWLVVSYLGSLAVLLITSFLTLGELSGEIEHTFTLKNYEDVVSTDVYRNITPEPCRSRRP